MNSPDMMLQWIDGQRDAMLRLVCRWAEINSYTHNLNGIARLAADVEAEFASLDATLHRHDLPPVESIDSAGTVIRSPLARAISFTKRPDAARRVLLNIHLDTVFPPHHPFQSVKMVDGHTLRGPGVVDAKGGIVVILTALRALESDPSAQGLGWEVILNPDEEIGSPGSSELLRAAAGRNQLGLVFEPSLPDGSLVSSRKGSGNYTFVVRGRSAHAGRDFHLGRSAILAVARMIELMDALQHAVEGVTVNCGRVEGGGAVNVVPDLAIARFNIRATRIDEQHEIERRLHEVAVEFSKQDGINVHVHGAFHSPPKSLDARSAKLLELIQECGKELGLKLDSHPSGGACDGNRLAAAGLPVIDTMGPRGGHLHSDQEYLLIDSLAERAKLTALLLRNLANGNAPLP